MPLYYFDILNHERDEDDQGKELSDDDAARVYAVIFAGEFLKYNPALIGDGRRFQVVVKNGERRTILTITATATAE